MPPFFSIIIPVYNCEKTIRQTLCSVLNQSFTDYEVIVIDDCSTDKTLKIIEPFNEKFKDFITITNNENLGVAKSRNRAFSCANGKYAALLDGDDLWTPDKLEKQFNVIENTGCDICCTSYEFINENSYEIKKPYYIPKFIDYKMLLKENYIGCSSAVVKRSLLVNNSMKSEYQHEDYALWLKLARGGASIIGINEPLMKYRIQSNSRSFDKRKAAKGRMMIYIKQENLGYIKSIYYLICYTKNGIKKKLL